jgi:hypothetical protein
MLSPRHRFHRIAPRLGLPMVPDGFGVKPVADELTKQLEAALMKPKKGARPNKKNEYSRAYEMYQQTSMRMMIDALLFTTQSVPATARLLREDDGLVRAYHDSFFDVTVFGNEAGRVAYLDAIFARDPEYAQMIRNMMLYSEQQLQFIADRSKADAVDPKTALDAGLTLHYNLMQIFMQLRLETLVTADPDGPEFKRFQKLHHMSVISANLVHKFADLLLRYDLDKNKQNFLKDFALNLSRQDAQALIASPDSDPLELI